jgi:NitT/TauT family transport system permease protein
MAISPKIAYTKSEAVSWPIPNYWDAIAFLLIFAIIFLLALGAQEMAVPFHIGQIIPISLDPRNLPRYALQTVLRMFIGLFFALLFTFIFGTWAGKSKKAEKIIIPIIDILQSVPVLSFLTITVSGFIALFKGSMLGPECAAIFAIFAAQAWNMVLSFYQSVRLVPHEFREAARIFQLSSWQSFWRVDVPFAMPGLVWNMMMSMSGSWFFIIASEAFSVANQKITLPGIGSYIALAITNADSQAIFYAIIAMLIVILIYDQFLFRPLSKWSLKFKLSNNDEEDGMQQTWIVKLFQKTVLFHRISFLLDAFSDAFVNLSIHFHHVVYRNTAKSILRKYNFSAIFYYLLLISLVIGAFVIVGYFIFTSLSFTALRHLLFLGSCTGLRVIVMVIISALIWVPIGVWVGFRPHIAAIIRPIAQFLAAFPANLTFPVMTILIMKFNLNVEIWVAPLMVLGTQWYILFNVIVGTMALPKNLRQAAATFGVTGWLKWRKLVLPGIFPYLLTGAITAAGGAWNASILAEVISWGTTNLHATGLGAYITEAASNGDFLQVVLGTVIMCLFVLLINRLVWRPMYNLAEKRFTLEQ